MKYKPVTVVIKLEADIEQKHFYYKFYHDFHSLVIGGNFCISFFFMKINQIYFMRQKVAVYHESLVQRTYSQSFSQISPLPFSQNSLCILKKQSDKLNTTLK